MLTLTDAKARCAKAKSAKVRHAEAKTETANAKIRRYAEADHATSKITVAELLTLNSLKLKDAKAK